MKLAIVGSRRFHDYDYLKVLLEPIRNQIVWIISGGARGVDNLAERYAREYKIPFLLFPANWDKYGKRAGLMRNQQIVDEADHMIALPSPDSKGTRDSIRRAEAKGITIEIFEVLREKPF